MINNSYMAASVFPSKLVCNIETIETIKDHKIKPLHVQ